MNKEQYLAGILYSINYIEVEKLNNIEDFRNLFSLEDNSQLYEKIQFVRFYLNIDDFDYNNFFQTNYSNEQIKFFLRLLCDFLVENTESNL